jgi:hypothetical protein
VIVLTTQLGQVNRPLINHIKAFGFTQKEMTSQNVPDQLEMP